MNPMTYVASLVFPLGGSVGDKGEIAVNSSYQALSPLLWNLRRAGQHDQGVLREGEHGQRGQTPEGTGTAVELWSRHV